MNLAKTVATGAVIIAVAVATGTGDGSAPTARAQAAVPATSGWAVSPAPKAVLRVDEVPQGVPMAAGEEEKVDVAALVRDVRQKEKWVEGAASFHMKADTVFAYSDKGLVQWRAELERDMGGPAPEIPVLKQRTTGTLELAFDRKRVKYEQRREGHIAELRVWDGTRLITDHGGITLTRDAGNLQLFWWDLSWPRADTRSMRMWWEPAANRMNVGLESNPEDFELVGRETFQGVPCYLLSLKGPNLMRWHVGIKDHLLYGFETGQMSGNPMFQEAPIMEARKHGAAVTTVEEFAVWKESLSDEEQKKVTEAVWATLSKSNKPVMAMWVSEFKELSPGCFFPLKHAHVWYGVDETSPGVVTAEAFARPWISSYSGATVKEASVGAPLPDQLFKIEFKEGQLVRDLTHEPPLEYKYKKEFTKAEWDAILKQAERRKAEEDAEKVKKRLPADLP